MNAITNALGTEFIDMPATPASVWAVLQRTHKLPQAA
jgi:CO/xanthine dehydrogenase Mo-binding subunit